MGWNGDVGCVGTTQRSSLHEVDRWKIPPVELETKHDECESVRNEGFFVSWRR